jgi:hypothetical protein
MKRFILAFTMILCLIAGISGVSYGKSSYATSFKSTYPSSPLSALSTVSGQAGNLCTVCHGTSGPPLNSYGTAYSNSGHNFGTIATQDSDGDTFNNITEINAGTFPGNAASKPAPTGDTTAPVVTAFSIPATSSSLTVSITSLTATDAVGVTGYLLTETSAKPSATAGGWSASKPANYTFASAGAKTLYAWAKDAAGNVSNSLSASVTITISDTVATSLVGVFKNGKWQLDLDGNDTWDGAPADALYLFGKMGDKPVVGDWDGSGISRIGVFRNGKWLLDLNGNGTWDAGVDGKYTFGQPGDKPVVGDWDGSGITRIGVVSAGVWYLDMNGDGAWDPAADAAVTYNVAVASDGDNTLSGKPVVGDWDGSGITRIGVVSAGTWYLDINGDGVWEQGVDVSFTFGPKGTPVTGAWQ